ncbi:MAG: glycosyltransferase family 4 protein [Lentisphaeria bacterium]|nr:glycosyltransferase family 4 protein [Lentisphaeria bacterium]
MHILFFSHYFPPEGNAPATRVHSMGRRWIEKGHKVTVITSAPNVPNGIVYDGYKNKLWQSEYIDGIRVIRIWTFLAANAGSTKRILNYLTYMFSSLFFSFFVSKVDLVMSTSPQFFCGWAGLLRAKLSFKKNILEIRDIWPESIVAVGAMKNKKLLAIFEWLELKMYKWSTHIVTVGNGYKANLLAKKVPDKKVDVITNGLDIDTFCAKDKNQDLLKRYKIEDKFIISYTGTIGLACGLTVVIEAAQQLKSQTDNSTHFLIVGDGAERKNLEMKANELDLADWITFTGRQDKDMVVDLIASSDACLVHLKKSDLFKTVIPSKIFEAAGMEKPIIMGVDGDARAIVEKAGAGLFMEPENTEELLKAIKTLKEDPKLRTKMGTDGNLYIKKHFDRENLAENYMKICKKVLN